MPEPDVRQLIVEYLAKAKMMQLATSVNNQPWVCNVWFAPDDELNLYWFSATNRRHSEEVEQNSRVAAAIILPFVPGEPASAVQLQGTARVMESDADVSAARSVYQDRIFPADQIDGFIAHPERPHKFYKLTPNQYVLFDAVNFPENSRQQLDL